MKCMNDLKYYQILNKISNVVVIDGELVELTNLPLEDAVTITQMGRSLTIHASSSKLPRINEALQSIEDAGFSTKCITVILSPVKSTPSRIQMDDEVDEMATPVSNRFIQDNVRPAPLNESRYDNVAKDLGIDDFRQYYGSY